jgi:acyl-CoA thioesterase II
VVDARTFLGLEATDDPLRFRMEVTRGVSTPGLFLFGGCGLAAGIVAVETVTGRPTIWATAQYLSYAPTGSVVDVEVVVPVSGHSTSQARAVARLDGEEILTVNAAVGSRRFDRAGTWAERPSVPPPEDCPPRSVPEMFAGTIMDRVEVRIASGRQMAQLDGTPGSGRTALWARVPGHLEPSAGTLAILGDYVPGGIGEALGIQAGGSSLDNTLRVTRLVPAEWVLCDIRVHAIEHGFGHGLAHLWAQDGTLLATASQSVIVRTWEDVRRRADQADRTDQASVPPSSS